MHNQVENKLCKILNQKCNLSKKKKFRERSSILHVAHSIKLQEPRTIHQIKAYRTGYNNVNDNVNNNNDNDDNNYKKDKNDTNSYHSLPTIL